MTTTALTPTSNAVQRVEALPATVGGSMASSLPSIAEVRQHMAWMTEFRPLLLEYVQTHMDPKRHFYSFENNRYTPLTPEALAAMMAAGQKPALNQDGIHNLMSLFECYADEPTIFESREDGHYTCRATVRLISLRSGQPMGAGTGSCSTRESKYAYRWVGDRQIPKGVDKSMLKQREMEGRSGTYTRYRLENEDLADVEATALQLAVKRGKSAAVKALPLVSEMFAAVGDPDEEKRDVDAERQALLAPLAAWLKGLRARAQVQAIQAVFGEPLRANDIPLLDEDRLAVACQVVEIATRAGVKWDAPTVMEDVRTALRASAAKAQSDLFGDPAPEPTPPSSSVAASQTPQDETLPATPVAAPVAPAPALEAPTRPKKGEAWAALRMYLDQDLPEDLREQVQALVASPTATYSHAQVLAAMVAQWLEEFGHGAPSTQEGVHPPGQ